MKSETQKAAKAAVLQSSAHVRLKEFDRKDSGEPQPWGYPGTKPLQEHGGWPGVDSGRSQTSRSHQAQTDPRTRSVWRCKQRPRVAVVQTDGWHSQTSLE